MNIEWYIFWSWHEIIKTLAQCDFNHCTVQDVKFCMSVTWIEEQKHFLPQRSEQLNLADEVELFPMPQLKLITLMGFPKRNSRNLLCCIYVKPCAKANTWNKDLLANTQVLNTHLHVLYGSARVKPVCCP